ncbi:hypothetical protein [Chryseobacterium indoltheticum]|jgi:hypothetical protein|uniref:hypothetical protein n=1 Tax=Chryseobacterium indoltheticum TaxID=254 RepID=UPI00242B2192|nr:hypothetical protein [Chryseobacterium indoltheticum]MDF2832350.1 hypothetical protein [Chryseobacterium indoltheticum]
MNKIILVKRMLYAMAFLSCGTLVYAQVAIGKGSVQNSSISLEFGNENRGMVLPWVTSAGDVAGAVEGTVVYDLSDHKVKVKIASGWKDLSVDLTGTTIDPHNSTVDLATIQNDVTTENTDAAVRIGTPTATPGILVLEDANKAMILPRVASPHLNIINPAPGMMVYDTVAKQLAVFNGTVWSFWKP